MKRGLPAVALLMIVACSDSTTPVDDTNPVIVGLPTLAVPVLVASSDRIYTLRSIDSTSRELDARRPDGNLAWTVPVPRCALATDACFIAADADGNVYMNSVDGLVSRSRSNGAARWTLGSAAGVASIAISTNGKIFAADRDRSPALMYAVDAANGSVTWSSILPPNFDASGTLLDEARGVVYAIGRGAAVAFDSQTGSIRWITSQNCLAGSTGALAADGTLYVTCDAASLSRLLAYSPAGSLMWQVSLGTSTGTKAPLIDASGIIYVANNNSLTELNKDGSQLWRLAGLFRNQTHPVIDAARNVYIVASRISSISGRYLMAVNGGAVAETKGLFPCSGSLLLNDSGRLYCAELGLFVFTRTSGFDAASQWSQLSRDASRSARR
jgi:outer membrane protein assembly factor BamB